MSTLLLCIAMFLGQPESFPDAVRQTVENYVQTNINLPADAYLIEFRNERQWDEPAQRFDRIRVVSEAAPGLKGNVTLPLEATSGETTKRFPVSIRIRTFESVFVTKRMLERGTALRAQDLEQRRLETTTIERPIRSDNELAGNRTKRILQPNTVLTMSMIEPVPVIKQNQEVTIVTHAGGVTLTTMGVAERDGYRGERIGVRRLDSRQQLYGLVVDANTIEVEVP